MTDQSPVPVLVVDDDEDDYLLTEALFNQMRGQHYVVDWAPSAEAARHAVLQQSHAVYLVDYHLGAESGLDLARALLDQGVSAPIILLTGQWDYTLDLKAMALGVADYLVKSELTVALLERSIRYARERTRLRRLRDAALDKAEAERERLRRSEEQYRTLYETMAQGVIYQDASGAITAANPAAERILGLTLDQMQGRTSMDPRWRAIYEDGRTALGDEHPAMVALRTGRPVSSVLGVYHPEEQAYHWISVHAIPRFQSRHERPWQVFTTFEDITARMKAQDDLQQNEARFRALTEHATDLTSVIDAEGMIHYASPSYQTILGYAPEVVVGQRILTVIHPDDKERVQSLFSTLIHTDGVIAMQFRMRHGNGSWRTVETVAVNRLADPAVRGIIATTRDVTVRTRAEETLRFQARLLDSVGQAVIATDLRAVVIYWNSAAETHFGWTAAEALGRNLGDLIVSPQMRAQSEAIMDALRQGAPWRGEFLVQRRDGSQFPALVTNTPLHDESGALIGIIGVATDITARKDAEETLRASEERFRALFDHAPVGIAFVDDQGRPVVTNTALQTMLGYSAQALTTMPFTAFTHSDDIAQDWALYQDLLGRRRASYTLDKRYVRADGQVVWVSLACALLTQTHGEPLTLGIVQDITARKEAAEHINRHVSRLSALRAIDTAITASMDLRLTLAVVLDQVSTQLSIDAAQVLLLNQQTLMLESIATRGIWGGAVAHAQLRLGQGHAGRAALERRMITASDLTQEEVVRVPLVADERFVAYVAMPLVSKGRVHGVLEIFHRTPLALEAEWLDFLAALAEQTAIAIDNAALYTDLQRTNTELVLAYDTTIEGWSRALDLRDKETEGHSQRVTDLTLAFARYVGISDVEMVHLRRGSLLHDIGKMGIPDAILLKPGPLTEEEWRVMKRHPVYAYDLLAPIAYLRQALLIPYCHHEKWDGTGYPRGLQGEQIPLAARIFALADVWDALRSDRPYRAAWPVEKVQRHIRSLAGTHFDPHIVEACLELAAHQ